MSGPADFLRRDGVTNPVHINIVVAAHQDIGEGEVLDDQGRGTNRGAYVDKVNARFGSPPGSYWCANAAAGWWKDGGAPELPPEPGSCDSWLHWAFLTNRFRHAPRPGYGVLYGTMKDASHMEVVMRTLRDPTSPWNLRTETIGGNCSLGQFSRDGWVVAQRAINMERLIGFVAVFPEDP